MSINYKMVLEIKMYNSSWKIHSEVCFCFVLCYVLCYVVCCVMFSPFFHVSLQGEPGPPGLPGSLVRIYFLVFSFLNHCRHYCMRREGESWGCVCEDY